MHMPAALSLFRSDNVWLMAGALLAVVLVLTLLVYAIKRLIRGRIVRWLSRTPTAIDDLIGFVLDRTGFFLVAFGVLWFAASSGYIPDTRAVSVRTLAIVAMFLQVTQWG